MIDTYKYVNTTEGVQCIARLCLVYSYAYEIRMLI